MSPAVSALLYLWSRSLLNLVVSRLKRLRQPKYLFGAVLAVGYVYLVFFRPRNPRQPRPEGLAEATDLAVLVTSLGSLFILLLFLLFWLWRRERTVLHFSEAEIAHLFPAPVAHRTLVHYNLIRSQVALVLSAAIIALFSAGSGSIPGFPLGRFVGWWLLMAVYGLHLTASGFTLTRLHDRGLGQFPRQLLVAALLAGAGYIIAYAHDGQLRLPLQQEMASAANLQEYAQAQLGSGALYWLLWPLRVLLQPFVAADVPALLKALGPALVVYGLHYLWALWAEIPNPEGAVATAQRRASRLAALRAGNFRFGRTQAASRPAPFRLAPTGSPEIAFLWKNLLSTRGYLRPRTALIAAAILVAIDFWVDARIATNPEYRIVPMIMAALALVFAFYTIIIGPQFARQDLRQDLEKADLLKSWPLAGWQIILGELLTPVAILTGILWLCLLQVGLTTPPPRLELTWQLRVVLGISLGLVTPFLCTIQLLVLNGGAVHFPAWTLTANVYAPQGLEVMGHRLLFIIGQWLVMMASLLPAVLIGTIAFLLAKWVLGDTLAVLAAAGAASLVLAAEIAWGINWLGECFDDFDLTA
jgi:hypothetical protein